MLAAEGIDVRTGAAATSVRHDERGFEIAVDGGEPVVAERLLVAVGRRADLATLGVGTVGLDEGCAPSLSTVAAASRVEATWALGDVTGRGAFTHMSMYEADIVVNDVLGREVVEADYHAVPRVTFTDPEIGSVGLTEAAARDAGLDVRTGHASIPESSREVVRKVGNEGFIKVVEDAQRGVLVGATSVGPSGGEVLGFLALAVAAAVPTHQLAHLPYAYPTFHRAIEAAVKDLGAAQQ